VAGSSRLIWGAVVAAGGTATADLQVAIGSPHKALASFGRSSSLAHVLAAVRHSEIQHCITIGSDAVQNEVIYGNFAEEIGSAVDNVAYGLEQLGEVDAVLFLPCDSPAIIAHDIDAFTKFIEGQARNAEWLGAGLTSQEAFVKNYPNVSTQSIKLSDGRFLSGSLYAATPAAFENAIEMFRAARRSRRNQSRMVLQFGLWNLIRYLLRRISSAQAPEVLARGFGADVIIQWDCHPRTCLDFDTAKDYQELLHWMESPRG